jgi:uncharacterized membrane protein
MWNVATPSGEQYSVSLDELMRQVNTGIVKSDTLVWTAGMPNWTRAGDVNLLVPVFAAVLNAPPPIPTGVGYSPPPSYGQPPMMGGQPQMMGHNPHGAGYNPHMGGVSPGNVYHDVQHGGLPVTTQEHRTMAVVAYILFFIPMLVDSVKNVPFVRFHVGQSMMIWIGYVALGFLGMVTVFISGWLSFFVWLAYFPMFIFWLLGLIAAYKGEQKAVPILGKMAFYK